MLFELITEERLNIQALYERTHITALQTSDNTYAISNEEAEAHLGVDQLEEFIIQTLRDLEIEFLSLNLINFRAHG